MKLTSISLQETVAKHEEDYDPTDVKDLIDEYIFEMEEAKKSGEPHLFRRGSKWLLKSINV